MAETLSLIATAALIAAAVCLVVTVVIFIRFGIPSVIGDLSGRTARKSIAQTRKNNEKSGRSDAQRKNPAKAVRQSRKESDPKTELLRENEITMPPDDEDGGTEFLDVYETSPLGGDRQSAGRQAGGIAIEILEEVMLVHSDEALR